MAILFFDDFNRADSDSLGAGWTERGDDFDIVSNRVAPTTFNGNNMVAYHASNIVSADYTVQAIRNGVGANPDGGVCGRRVNYSTDDSDCYALFSSVGASGGLRLYRRQTGGWTLIGTYVTTITSGVDYTIKLSMQGTSIKGFLDGVERISVVDSTFSVAGDAGIIQYGGTWDDFLVEDFTVASNINARINATAGQNLFTLNQVPTGNFITLR